MAFKATYWQSVVSIPRIRASGPMGQTYTHSALCIMLMYGDIKKAFGVSKSDVDMLIKIARTHP